VVLAPQKALNPNTRTVYRAEHDRDRTGASLARAAFSLPGSASDPRGWSPFDAAKARASTFFFTRLTKAWIGRIKSGHDDEGTAASSGGSPYAIALRPDGRLACA